MSAPTVSVITPAYNADHFVTEALDSVMAQIYKDFEVIVTDDGSTDDTERQVEAFSQKVRHIYQPTRHRVWDNPEIEWWYAQNLIVFVKASHLGNYPELRETKHGLSLVHPRKYLQDLLSCSRSQNRFSLGDSAKNPKGSGNWLCRLWARMRPPDGRP